MENRPATLLSRFRDTNHIGLVSIGWFLGLILAALFIPPPDFGARHGSAFVKVLLGVLGIWFLYTVVAVPLYFYRAWRRLPTVPNKVAYATWLGFETFVVISLLSAIAYALGR